MSVLSFSLTALDSWRGISTQALIFTSSGKSSCFIALTIFSLLPTQFFLPDPLIRCPSRELIPKLSSLFCCPSLCIFCCLSVSWLVSVVVDPLSGRFLNPFFFSIYLLGFAGSSLQPMGSLLFSCSMQTLSCGMWDLVSWPGIEPGFPALEAWSLSHWTTSEVP